MVRKKRRDPYKGVAYGGRGGRAAFGAFAMAERMISRPVFTGRIAHYYVGEGW